MVYIHLWAFFVRGFSFFITIAIKLIRNWAGRIFRPLVIGNCGKCLYYMRISCG